MSNPKIEIKNNGTITEIYVDGHKLNGVRSLRFEHGVGSNIPILTIDLNALNLSIDSYAILKHAGFGDIDIKFGFQKE